MNFHTSFFMKKLFIKCHYHHIIPHLIYQKHHKISALRHCALKTAIFVYPITHIYYQSYNRLHGV